LRPSAVFGFASPAYEPVKLRIPAQSPAAAVPRAPHSYVRAITALVGLMQDGGVLERLDLHAWFGPLESLFELLPSDLPEIDPYLSNVGSISFDWDEDPSNSLSLMLQPDGRVGFAAYFAGARFSGISTLSAVPFRRDVLPLVQRWLDNSVRVAG
jgi:hypothetical protein